MATLLERTEELIKRQQQYLDQAIKAKEMVNLLPPELQALNGEADTGWYGIDLKVEFNTFYNDSADLLKIAKMAGVQGLQSKMYYPDNWHAIGELMLSNGLKAEIHLGHLPKPPACRIEEYQETVTKYKAICEETGKEV